MQSLQRDLERTARMRQKEKQSLARSTALTRVSSCSMQSFVHEDCKRQQESWQHKPATGARDVQDSRKERRVAYFLKGVGVVVGKKESLPLKTDSGQRDTRCR